MSACAECELHRGDPDGVPPHDHDLEVQLGQRRVEEARTHRAYTIAKELNLIGLAITPEQSFVLERLVRDSFAVGGPGWPEFAEVLRSLRAFLPSPDRRPEIPHRPTPQGATSRHAYIPHVPICEDCGHSWRASCHDPAVRRAYETATIEPFAGWTEAELRLAHGDR